MPIPVAVSATWPDPVIISLTVFVLACFIGYYVVWRVTPALHSPLMAVTNAISSVIIVGALIAAGATAQAQGIAISQVLGFAAITLAAVNIFGGFVISPAHAGEVPQEIPRAQPVTIPATVQAAKRAKQ